MDERLVRIFDFLKENRSYNNRLHDLDYSSALLPYTKKEDKVLSLLFQTLNTQSNPKIDQVYCFAKTINRRKNNLNTFNQLLISLGAAEEDLKTYDLLFKLLLKHKSWGNKTAALFVKAIYKTHYGEQKHLSFYNDTPKLTSDDKLYLPVDRVILNIFSKMKIGTPNTFKGINNYLSEFYSSADIEVWDDLWYWGFITQRGGDKNRSFEFNEAKYWIHLHNDKREKVLKIVRIRAHEFIKLITAQV